MSRAATRRGRSLIWMSKPWTQPTWSLPAWTAPIPTAARPGARAAAHAKGKPIVCYRTDFRITGDTAGRSGPDTERERHHAPKSVSNQYTRIPPTLAGADPRGGERRQQAKLKKTKPLRRDTPAAASVVQHVLPLA